MELTVKVRLSEPMEVKRAANIATKMGTYSSQVLMKSGNITVNAKSLMGILTMNLQNGQAITIVAEGDDEAQAINELTNLLNEK